MTDRQSSTVQPLVGITSYLDTAAWGVWRQPAALIPQWYVDAVTRAGGTAVLLPPQAADTGRLLERLDGLLLSGGPDIAPDRYAADPHPSSGPFHEERDDWELELLNGALELDLPVLGICRGMQLLNVAHGGDLIQHLPEKVGDDGHRIAPATFHQQAVEIQPDSRLGEILGRTAKVPCYHHQAVGRLGTGLRATAWSADRSVEALERPDRRFALGVQWHPEADPADPRLFEAFVQAAGRGHQGPSGWS
ncbi:gamma-glutamyl-gamma-aminobutyrate hydrolase family protein [Kitasatospora sp. GP82]|uniref:gamma-glutamyl-gamma-aminobutyrate hydrolase family protein n=1 Tax=Kitasatospora sp. GP82 TaxID=3035089 RepID=UPI0024750FA6|nr:gamma-glutamyl-gamma-aminobutyrate hydrolase family protein [Kitasatospora sp. GP82]MDH6128894.1 putative glutamine amidotransferase [Kitasatospora sp. GP82]